MRQFITLTLLLCILPLQAALQEVTYTITSTKSVLAEGNEPIGSIATFEQTGSGQKGQMTAGNSTLFTLTGLQGLHLYGVTLQMRSNSKTGAGQLQMYVGQDMLWQISESSFANEAWNGYFTTAFVPITWENNTSYVFDNDNNTLQIQIIASENSLYVSSYTLTYSTTAESPVPYTVHFNTGSHLAIESITEKAMGEGIILPHCSSVDSIWHFMGWTEIAVSPTDNKAQLPTIYAANERYYPTKEQILYAVYSDKLEDSNIWIQDTLLESGYYLFVDSLFDVIPYGGLNSKGRISTSPITISEQDANGYCIFPKNSYIDEAVYFIDFLPDSLALIQHVKTGEYIGYPSSVSGSLVKDSVAWNYRTITNQSVVFYHAFGSQWVQFRAKPDAQSQMWYQAYKTTYTQSANILFNIADLPEETTINYTSYPWGMASIQQDVLPSSIMLSPKGVDNPEKLLLCLYTINGSLYLKTTNNIMFANIPQGIYILQSGQAFCKLYIH